MLYPGVQTAIAGVLAGALADSIGWPGQPFGLGLALVLWTIQLLAALPAAKTQAPMLPVEQTVRVNLLTEDARQGEYIRLSVGPDRLQEFAEGLTQGRGLSTREWAGMFTPQEHAQLCGQLMAAGLVEWAREGDPKAGRQLTPRGRRVMEKLAPPAPPGL